MNDKFKSLQTQLAELNTRSRAYATQLWQVPFAYLGIIGVILTQVSDNSLNTVAAFLFSGLFGIAVLIHMTAMMDGVKRAVENIVKVEEELGLERTAKYSPAWHIGPFIAVVSLVAVSSFFAAGYFLCKLGK
jgi:TctA family transporter